MKPLANKGMSKRFAKRLVPLIAPTCGKHSAITTGRARTCSQVYTQFITIHLRD